MNKRVLCLLVVVAVLAVALAGCSETVEQTGAVINVGGINYYASEVEAMDQVTVSAAHPKSGEVADYSGVSLLALMDRTGMSGDTITVVASDGYEKEIASAEIPEDGLVVLDGDSYRLVMPDMSSSAWVKNVVEIR